MRKAKLSNRNLIYIIAALVIIIALIVFGAFDWIKDVRISRSLDTANLNWTHVIVSVVIGFGIGWLVFRRR